MCSVFEEPELSGPEKRVQSSSTIKKCMKCDQQAVVIIRVNDAMCRHHFIEYTTHKFRSAFGKSKLIRDQEKVLVAFSGGAGAAAMVHLTQEGLSKRAQKKLRFIPSLVYIDEGAILKQTHDERCQTTEEVVGLMRDTGLDYSTYCLEQAMQFSKSEAAAGSSGECGHLDPLVGAEDDEALSSLMSRLKVNEDATMELCAMLNGAKTLTAKDRLVDILRLRLLSVIAKQHGVSKVLLGDTASRLSVRLLSNIAQGQGAHLPYEIGFADKRNKDVTYIRPLREFTAKEIAVYNELNDVKTIFIPNLSTKVPPHKSIDQLTENFVAGLQAEYPNTVSTIFRTGEKFDLQGSYSTTEESCVLCQCPLDTDVGPSSALSATQFSQSLCTNMAASHKVPTAADCCQGSSGCHGNKPDQSEGCCGEGDGSCTRSTTNRLTQEHLDPWLCYGCRLLVKDMESVETLPSDLIQEIARKGRRKQMKEEISEFLLEG